MEKPLKHQRRLGLGDTRPRGYKTLVQSQAQNIAQWLAACGHMSARSQSLRFILSLRMNSSFITWPGNSWERSGSVVEFLTQRPRGCRFEPLWPASLLFALSKTHLSLLSTGLTQENPSWHNWKFVGTYIKNQIKQNNKLETEQAGPCYKLHRQFSSMAWFHNN